MSLSWREWGASQCSCGSLASMTGSSNETFRAACCRILAFSLRTSSQQLGIFRYKWQHHRGHWQRFIHRSSKSTTKQLFAVYDCVLGEESTWLGKQAYFERKHVFPKEHYSRAPATNSKNTSLEYKYEHHRNKWENLVMRRICRAICRGMCFQIDGVPLPAEGMQESPDDILTQVMKTSDPHIYSLHLPLIELVESGKLNLFGGSVCAKS